MNSKKVIVVLIFLLQGLYVEAQPLSEKPYSLTISVVFDVYSETRGNISVEFSWYGSMADYYMKLISNITEQKFREILMSKVRNLTDKPLIGGFLKFSPSSDPSVFITNGTMRNYKFLRARISIPVEVVSGEVKTSDSTRAIVYSTMPEDSRVSELYLGMYDVFNLTFILPPNYKVAFVMPSEPSIIYTVEQQGTKRVVLNWFTTNPYSAKLAGAEIGVFKIYASTSTEEIGSLAQNYDEAYKVLSGRVFSNNISSTGSSARKFFEGFNALSTLNPPLLRYNKTELIKYYNQVMSSIVSPTSIYAPPLIASIIVSMLLILYYIRYSKK
ncbi:MAG: hypothetical protein ACP5JF_00990 [Candidatus Methanodesulfokora sp.]|jgi:hypothetical protein